MHCSNNNKKIYAYFAINKPNLWCTEVRRGKKRLSGPITSFSRRANGSMMTLTELSKVTFVAELEQKFRLLDS